jgi:hypothetical protein
VFAQSSWQGSTADEGADLDVVVDAALRQVGARDERTRAVSDNDLRVEHSPDGPIQCRSRTETSCPSSGEGGATAESSSILKCEAFLLPLTGRNEVQSSFPSALLGVGSSAPDPCRSWSTTGRSRLGRMSGGCVRCNASNLLMRFPPILLCISKHISARLTICSWLTERHIRAVLRTPQSGVNPLFGVTCRHVLFLPL